MTTMQGFGFTYDLRSGVARQWYVGKDGVKRWGDNNKPVEDATMQRQSHNSNEQK
jgi:hypothetical protein